MDWLQTTNGIITLISTGVILIGGLITTAISLVNKIKEIAKMIKEKKYGEVVDLLKKTADAAIRSVEDSKKSGFDKKELVLEAVKSAADELGVEFTSDLKNQISAFIDTTVAEYNQFHQAKEANQ